MNLAVGKAHAIAAVGGAILGSAAAAWRCVGIMRYWKMPLHTAEAEQQDFRHYQSESRDADIVAVRL